MADGALFGRRRHDQHFAQLTQFRQQGAQAGCIDAVVVREQDAHSASIKIHFTAENAEIAEKHQYQ